VLLSLCGRSLHAALRITWLLRAAATRGGKVAIAANALLDEVETVATNGSVMGEVSKKAVLPRPRRGTATSSLLLAPPRRASSSDEGEAQEEEDHHNHPNHPNNPNSRNHDLHPPHPTQVEDIGDLAHDAALLKQVRCDYYNAELGFARRLSEISECLKQVWPKELRRGRLHAELERLNLELLSQSSPLSVYLPHLRATDRHHRVLRIVHNEAVVLNSAEKTPFMMLVEVQVRRSRCEDEDIYHAALWRPSVIGEGTVVVGGGRDRFMSAAGQVCSPPPPLASLPAISRRAASEGDCSAHEDEEDEVVEEEDAGEVEDSGAAVASARSRAQTGASDVIVHFGDDGDGNEDAAEDPDTSQELKKLRKVPSRTISAPRGASGTPGVRNDNGGWVLLSEDGRKPPATHAPATPFGEFWAEKEERLKRDSPFSHLSNWRLLSVIVKAGDDCRQEAFAMQLIETFKEVYTRAHLPLYLRPFRVLVLSADCGLIETVTDSLSLTSIKTRVPNFTTLLNYFIATYGSQDSVSFRLAQRNFIESMAAYSVVTYFLQIKDRHNGNIMLDVVGHLFHIDFGFLLSNSPGGVNFENAPFKLNNDFVDVMGGPGSDGFMYFEKLCTAFFLECRKRHRRITLPVELMLQASPGMPCLALGQAVVQGITDRMRLELDDLGAEEHMRSLIRDAQNSWRTGSYDYFQRVTQNIM
jgi:hypothetical protein